MASPTRKRKKIKKAKDTAQGSRRKKEIRADNRNRIAQVAKQLGLKGPDDLAPPEA